MDLLTKDQRKEIFKRTCERYHQEGIKRLELIGHIEKYTPLFHYTLAEPSKDQSHIFVTELFGNQDFKVPSIDGNIRIQYQGDYGGLNLVLATQVGHQNFPSNVDFDFKQESRYSEEENADFLNRCDYDQKLHKSVDVSFMPSWLTLGNERNMDPKLRENFDRSLKYLDWMLGFIVPDSFRTNVGSEQIRKLYHVL